MKKKKILLGLKMMEYWKIFISCFSCCKKQSELLKQHPSELIQTYTVRRISSFGRSESKDDLEKLDQLNENSTECVAIPCDRVTLTVQLVNEECEEAKDVKHKKRWKKALSKVHKKHHQIVRDDNKDNKSSPPCKLQEDEKCEDKGGDCDKTVSEECDKKLASKDKPKDNRGLNWNKALSAVQKKKDCNISDTMKVPNTDGLLTQSDQTINSNIPSLSTTKSSIDLHSMDYLSPTSARDSSWLKSQSMQDIKSLVSDTTKSKSSTEDSAEIAKAHGLDLSFYQNSPVSKSAEAVDRARQSLDKPDSYQELPSGTIFFEVDYDENKKKFIVQVEKVSRLVSRSQKKEPIKFIIKLTVLPGQKEVFSTKKYTVESSIGEQFTFHVKDVVNKVLRLSLYDAHWKKGKYDAIGHALFYIEDVLQPFSRLHQMKLYKQSIPDVNPGTVQVSMSFVEKTEMLNLTVIQVENMNIGKCKVFIKVMSFCQGHKVKEKCSASLNCSKETVFNYTVSFKVDTCGMKHNYLVISVKKAKDKRELMKQDKTVGRLILGPYFYAENGKTYTPWGKVILCNEQLTHSFRLYL